MTENANETPTAAVRRAHASVQKDYNDLSDLVEQLRSAPDAVCTQILKSLRTNLSPVAILATLREESPVHLAITDQEMSDVMPTSPVSAAEVDDGLIQYPTTALDMSGLHKSSTSIRPGSEVYLGMGPCIGAADDGATLSSSPLSSYSDHRSRDSLPYSSLSVPPVAADLAVSDGLQVGNYSATIDPHSIPAYHDERLHQLQIHHWTNVPISNEFAANAISFCMETNQEALVLLDLNLFINDLVYWGEMSCSALLVNSLLSWALVYFLHTYSETLVVLTSVQRAYIGIVPNMSSMSLAFTREAQGLWIGNRIGDSLPGVTALGLLGINEDSQGHIINGAKWKSEAQSMAGRLGFADLFSENPVSQI